MVRREREREKERGRRRRKGSEKEFKIENVMTKEMLSQHKRTTI
jgi:hypothetical protein